VSEPNETAGTEAGSPATVPFQPEAVAPLRKKFPLVLILGGIVLLFGIVNLVSLVSGKKADSPKGSLAMRPATPNPQQVYRFETQQALEAQRDAQQRARQQQIADQMRQLQAEQQALTPGPEGQSTSPMTPAQRTALYGEDNPNAPKHTSGVSEAQAEAKQRALARERRQQEAINSDTVAIDFARPSGDATANADGERTQRADPPGMSRTEPAGAGNTPGGVPVQPVSEERARPEQKEAAIRGYDFDEYQGKLYRVFEGTVFEGVVTNHIDGAFSGPVLIMLTADYYSHDLQQLLLPQGTRLIGTVESVNSGQQRKLFAAFHRAVCPDGFSVDLDKFAGLDPLGTTGLATKVNNRYFSTFAAAAAIGGLGGLAQIGNGGIGIVGGDPGVMIRDGVSAQTAQEGEQVMNHFLNRLPIITLKEGSRARVYVGRDILIPSYADHRVQPNL
jgi:type IV secretory pathway VirB10-like protein